MDVEIQALQVNSTWVLSDLPPGKKAIGSKWVYKIKLKSDGTLDKHKARLVIQGNHQKDGVDYLQTFSSVIKMATTGSIIALAASKNWLLH